MSEILEYVKIFFCKIREFNNQNPKTQAKKLKN